MMMIMIMTPVQKLKEQRVTPGFEKHQTSDQSNHLNIRHLDKDDML